MRHSLFNVLRSLGFGLLCLALAVALAFPKGFMPGGHNGAWVVLCPSVFSPTFLAAGNESKPIAQDYTHHAHHAHHHHLAHSSHTLASEPQVTHSDASDCIYTFLMALVVLLAVIWPVFIRFCRLWPALPVSLFLVRLYTLPPVRGPPVLSL